ncbi:11160_t:CDS:2 [Rhizophagus irregularis]|nr:11160_t:CDS:2 [Rhizophagus irregularis]
MTLRLKQLQNKFWIEDNIVSVFPFDNNFYKKLFYSKRNYDNWILENIKILKNNNIDISINNKLSIEKYKITGGNNIPPKKWYKELQNIITIDGKTLKPEYKTSAVSHFKGYNMAQCEIDRNNILKQLTFIGVWNNRSNDIEIGCELDNIEQLNQKTFNCNILVNTNDCLIVRVQSNNAINDVHYRLILNNNNLKAILQTNLLDITDLSYNNFLFKNNWKSYETTINHSVLSIDRLVKINDNLITKLLDFSHD